ncbi:MAG TPA: hypothetical protein PK156_49645, partial [Polyangium sp.]|nr:hypothetical protein [Polyangium sp.]
HRRSLEQRILDWGGHVIAWITCFRAHKRLGYAAGLHTEMVPFFNFFGSVGKRVLGAKRR